MSQPGTISAIPGINDAQLFAMGTDTLVSEADTVVPGVEDPSHYTISFVGVTPGEYRLVLRVGVIVAGIEPKVTVTSNGWSVAEAGGSAPGPGTGPRTVVATVRLAGNPLEGAIVRLERGAEFRQATTNFQGQVTFNVSDGTWIVAITAPGASFGGASIVVDGNESPVFNVTQDSISPPALPGLCTVRFSVVDRGQPLEGAKVHVELEEKNPTVETALVSRVVYGGVTSASGFVDLVLIQFDSFTRGGVYRIRVADANGRILHDRRVRVPTLPTCYAEDLLDA
jgi:hypothetical protein